MLDLDVNTKASMGPTEKTLELENKMGKMARTFASDKNVTFKS
jgi:hypothetical protein